MRAYFIMIAIGLGVVTLSPARKNHEPTPIPAAAPGQSEDAPCPVKANIVAYRADDATINAAYRQARERLPRFHELMSAKTPGTYQVKFPLTQNGATEHIWLQVDAHRNGTFHGRLANEPNNGNAYKLGQRMSVAAEQVEDWMVMSGDVIYGGYTTRVALADFPEEQAKVIAKRFRD